MLHIAPTWETVRLVAYMLLRNYPPQHHVPCIFVESCLRRWAAAALRHSGSTLVQPETGSCDDATHAERPGRPLNDATSDTNKDLRWFAQRLFKSTPADPPLTRAEIFAVTRAFRLRKGTPAAALFERTLPAALDEDFKYYLDAFDDVFLERGPSFQETLTALNFWHRMVPESQIRGVFTKKRKRLCREVETYLKTKKPPKRPNDSEPLLSSFERWFEDPHLVNRIRNKILCYVVREVQDDVELLAAVNDLDRGRLIARNTFFRLEECLGSKNLSLSMLLAIGAHFNPKAYLDFSTFTLDFFNPEAATGAELEILKATLWVLSAALPSDDATLSAISRVLKLKPTPMVLDMCLNMGRGKAGSRISTLPIFAAGLRFFRRLLPFIESAHFQAPSNLPSSSRGIAVSTSQEHDCEDVATTEMLTHPTTSQGNVCEVSSTDDSMMLVTTEESNLHSRERETGKSSAMTSESGAQATVHQRAMPTLPFKKRKVVDSSMSMTEHPTAISTPTQERLTTATHAESNTMPMEPATVPPKKRKVVELSTKIIEMLATPSKEQSKRQPAFGPSLSRGTFLRTLLSRNQNESAMNPLRNPSDEEPPMSEAYSATAERTCQSGLLRSIVPRSTTPDTIDPAPQDHHIISREESSRSPFLSMLAGLNLDSDRKQTNIDSGSSARTSFYGSQSISYHADRRRRIQGAPCASHYWLAADEPSGSQPHFISPIGGQTPSGLVMRSTRNAQLPAPSMASIRSVSPKLPTEADFFDLSNSQASTSGHQHPSACAAVQIPELRMSPRFYVPRGDNDECA